MRSVPDVRARLLVSDTLQARISYTALGGKGKIALNRGGLATFSPLHEELWS